MANLLVDWANNTEADMALYRVYRSSSPTGTFTLLATVSHPQSNYLDTAPIMPTSSYKVSAVDAVGNESSLTSAVSVTQEPPVDIPPVDSTVDWRQSKYLGVGVTSGAFTLGPPLAGSTVVAFLFWRGNVTCTLSTSKGDTCADCGSGRVARPQDGFMQAFYAKNIVGGATTFTANFSGTPTFMYMILVEVVGANTTNPINTFSSGTMSSGTAMITNSFSPSTNKGLILAFADGSTTTTRDQIAGINAENVLTVDEVTAIVEGLAFESALASNITARANTTSSAIGAILAVCLGSDTIAPPPNPVMQSFTPLTSTIDIGETQTLVVTLDRPPQAVETALITYNWNTFELPITMPASITFSTNATTGSIAVTALAAGVTTVTATYRGVSKNVEVTVATPDIEVPTSPLPINTKGTVATDPVRVWSQYLLN